MAVGNKARLLGAGFLMIMMMGFVQTPAAASIGTISATTSASQSASSITGSCANASSVFQQNSVAISSLDNARSIQLAKQYLSAKIPSVSTDNTSVFIVSHTAPNCVTSVTEVGVALFSSNGGSTIIVIETPSLSAVVNYTTYSSKPLQPINNNAINNNVWGGYEYSNYTGGSYHAYTSNVAMWNIPSVSLPSYGCYNSTCDLAVWVGETNQAAGHESSCNATYGCIAQIGTDSNVSCNILWCSYWYNMWYEYLPAKPVYCAQISSGDSITAAVVNRQNGQPSTTYTLNIYDNTNAKSCTATQSFSSMGYAYYAQFMGEARVPGYPAHFSQVSISEAEVCGLNARCAFIGAVNAGTAQEYTMPHDTIGSISLGDFTETWSSS